MTMRTPLQDLTPAEAMLSNARDWMPLGGLGNLCEGLAYEQVAAVVARIWGRDSEEWRYVLDWYNVTEEEVQNLTSGDPR